MTRHPRLVTLVLITLVAGLCCAGEDGPGLDGQEIPCDRCDGWVDAARNADVGDLLAVGSRYATEAINDAAGLSGRAPSVYALSHVAAGDNTVRDIDELVTGLGSRFGETDLTTEVNRARRDYLAANGEGHRYFAESTFGLDASLGRAWTMEVPGLGDGSFASVGFTGGGALEGRVVAPYGSELQAHLRGNVLSLLLDEAQGRGFVLGRSLEEIEAMRPGELFALSGRGNTGFYFTLSAPILMTTVTTGLTYNIVLRATVQVRATTDQLDVQCVRLEGDEVVVDVGSSHARVDGFDVRIEDAFGVHGLVAEHIDVPSVVASALERAIERELNRRLTFTARVSSSRVSDARLTVSRVRFHLSQAHGEADGALDSALGQALHGDVRLAQLLAGSGHPGVEVDFDLSRSGVQSTFYAGVQLFGMEFFHQEIEREGAIVIQTPQGIRTLLFDLLVDEGGAFWWSHRYSRASLAGVTVGPEGATGEAGLYLQFADEDSTIDRDKLLDTVDGIVLALAGVDVYESLVREGNAIQARVERECQWAGEDGSMYDSFAECAEAAVAMVASDVRVAEERFAGRVASLPEDARRLATEAAHLRLATQSVAEESLFMGPSMELLTDFRLDDGALADLMTVPGTELRAALETYLRASGVYRSTDPDALLRNQDDLASRNRSALDAMVARWDESRALYAEQDQRESITLPGLGAIRDRGGFVVVRPEGATEPAMQSFAQARAGIARRAVDRLVADAADLSVRSLHHEQIVLYSLLALTDPARLDLRFDVRMRDDGLQGDAYPDAGYRSSRSYAAGPLASRLSGGMFDIDCLVTSPF